LAVRGHLNTYLPTVYNYSLQLFIQLGTIATLYHALLAHSALPLPPDLEEKKKKVWEEGRGGPPPPVRGSLVNALFCSIPSTTLRQTWQQYMLAGQARGTISTHASITNMNIRPAGGRRCCSGLLRMPPSTYPPHPHRRWLQSGRHGYPHHRAATALCGYTAASFFTSFPSTLAGDMGSAYCAPPPGDARTNVGCSSGGLFDCMVPTILSSVRRGV